MTASVLAQAFALVFDPYVLWVILASAAFGLSVGAVPGSPLSSIMWLAASTRNPAIGNDSQKSITCLISSRTSGQAMWTSGWKW